MAGETYFDSRAGSHDRVIARFQVPSCRKLVLAVSSNQKMREKMTRQTFWQRYAQAQALYCTTTRITMSSTIRRNADHGEIDKEGKFRRIIQPREVGLEPNSGRKR